MTAHETAVLSAHDRYARALANVDRILAELHEAQAELQSAEGKLRELARKAPEPEVIRMERGR